MSTFPALTGYLLASAQTLTASYAATTSIADFDTNKVSQITVYRVYEPGAGETSNTMELVVETSMDGGTTWHQEGVIDDTTTTAAVDAPITFQSDSKDAGQTFTGVPIRIPISAAKTRVRIKETGKASTFGTATIRVSLQYV